MYMPKKTKLKARRKIRQKTRKYRKYGGTPPRLAESKKNVAAILSRLQASQDQSRSNIQKMYEYIKRLENDEPGPAYDLGQEDRPLYQDIVQGRVSPLYQDLGPMRLGSSPLYQDLGQAEPVYQDLAQAEPVYDLAEAHPSPAVFAKIIKHLADKSQVYSREDLIKLTPENASKYLGYNILFVSRNQYITKKILGVSKTGKSIQIEHPDLKNSLEIVSRKVYVILKKSPLYDLGRAMSPVYDMGMATGSPEYDLGMATGSPEYDMGMATGSPEYDLGRATGSPEYDLGMATGSPEYDLGMATGSPEYDLGMATGSPEYDELKVEPTKLDIAPGSWFFYTLKIVDSQPKTEKELCEIMKVKYPVRLTGKTPCNTLNRVLQILAKNGYISRMPYTSAKGTAKSSAKGTAQKRQKYKYFVNDVSVV
jgi:hypothetical protein